MGYGVYEEFSNGRWAGYMVPAECDFPDCKAEIDRGLAYKCEEHVTYDANDVETVEEGCELFFCSDHRYDAEQHAEVQPKPDSPEWVRWMLTDKSWKQWRAENPERAEAMRAHTALGATPTLVVMDELAADLPEGGETS